ncbi:MAG: NADH-ubiquinone oxidoreductase chain H, partial [uncultured Acidimicrobiales bacterium]
VRARAPLLAADDHQDGDRAVDHPGRRSHPGLRLPAQDDGPHAEPDGAHGARRLPRLVPAHRRRDQVHPEGGHHPGTGRPAGVRPGPARRPHLHLPAVRGRPRRPPAGRPGPRRRHLLRPRRVIAGRHRRAHGRLGLGQQVRPSGVLAGRRPADRLRAAAGARGGRRGHPGQHHEPAGHRPCPGRRRHLRHLLDREPVHPHPDRGFRRVPGRRPGRADPDALRHASRRVGAGRRLHDRVLGVPLPLLLHGGVRHRVRPVGHRRHPLLRRLVPALLRDRHPGRHPRAGGPRDQGDAHRLPHLLDPFHVPAFSRRPAPGLRLEVPHPHLPRQHHGDRGLQGGAV